MLPIDNAGRKSIPLYNFLTGYFPDALVELTRVSVEGNKQHNPGEPLHWARGKSMDQLNTAMRHIFDHGAGIRYDSDGTMHLAKAAWRILAEIQLMCEKRDALAEQMNRQTPNQEKAAQQDSQTVLGGVAFDMATELRYPDLPSYY